jgi:salicylate hydroxylase
MGGKTLPTPESRKWIPDCIARRMNVVMPSDKYFFFNAIYDRSKKEPLATACMENYVLWSFIGHKNEFEGIHRDADLKKVVLQKIGKWDLVYKKLVAEAEDDSLLLLRIKTMLPVKPWVTTNVTLLGDAIHNMTPLQGMGANMALFDAASLATRVDEIVNQGRSTKEAIGEYEKTMIKKGFDAVAVSMKYTNQAIAENKFSRFMNRNWFRLCYKIPAIKRITFGNNWK